MTKTKRKTYKCNCGAKKEDGITVHERSCATVRKDKGDWTKNEIFAIDEFTCEYPDKISFEEVMKLIEEESEDVTIWEPFEDEPGECVCEKINDMVLGLDRTYPAGAK